MLSFEAIIVQLSDYRVAFRRGAIIINDVISRLLNAAAVAVKQLRAPLQPGFVRALPVPQK